MAAQMLAEGTQVSESQVWRILAAMDIDPTKVRGWLNRRDDPTFWERVRDICALYLSPPERALVLSVDEKTSIQAKQRRHPDQPARRGRHRRRKFEYVRHGTASLVAALDVHSGEVLAEPIPGKNDSVNFCEFLDGIENAVDPKLTIHVVLDNGSSHVSKGTKSVVRRPSPLGRALHADSVSLSCVGNVVVFPGPHSAQLPDTGSERQ